ncbi:hypothetical protein CPC08DRAFT_505613 [Agrocybe pediades]|nr:hypothetical protein CPC08DRAFT_505613 [Agrocybe pediades]
MDTSITAGLPKLLSIFRFPLYVPDERVCIQCASAKGSSHVQVVLRMSRPSVCLPLKCSK